MASGRKLVLVTGRQLDDLLQIFPEIALFERVIAENVAVLYCPSTGETKMLAGPTPQAFIDYILQRGVSPFAIRSVNDATDVLKFHM